jgi:hypothetical protein
MSLLDDGFALLMPEAQHWRPSNLMKIPNANLLHDLGGADHLGGRLWRLPPFSANTWHGRMRIGERTVTVPKYGSALVAPRMLRQVFNDTPEHSLWLIVAAPQEGQSGSQVETSHFYPQDPKSLPAELAGRVWPPD